MPEDRLSGAAHESGQGIDQRGLAGPVRADEEVQPALQKGEVDPVDCLEPVEVNGQVADLEVVLLEERGRHATTADSACPDRKRDFSLGHSEATPPGRNRMTRMKSAPRK